MFSERTRLRLQDIVEDAGRIATFLGDMDPAAFQDDERTMLAVERLLQRVTEAVVQIGSTDMDRIRPDLPVRTIRAFGNILRHQYRTLDVELVYRVARDHVPPLAAAAARALEGR